MPVAMTSIDTSRPCAARSTISTSSRKRTNTIFCENCPSAIIHKSMFVALVPVSASYSSVIRKRSLSARTDGLNHGIFSRRNKRAARATRSRWFSVCDVNFALFFRTTHSCHPEAQPKDLLEKLDSSVGDDERFLASLELTERYKTKDVGASTANKQPNALYLSTAWCFTQSKIT